MSDSKPRKRSVQVWRYGRWFLATSAIYIVAGNVLHHWVFPLPAPDPATYPRTGDEFGSTYEGFHQRVIEVVDGGIVGVLVVDPGAVGPPLHYHKGFAEEFHVREGVLHLELADRVVTLGPGESYRVEPFIEHRPFNPGSERVVIASDKPGVPQSFAACLVQLYPLLDETKGVSLSVLLQMSVIDSICDTHVADPPGPVLAAMNLFLTPAARLLGYTNYDPHRALHPS